MERRGNGMRLFSSELKKLLFTPVSFFLVAAALVALIIVPAKDVIRYRTVNQEQLGKSVEDIVEEVNTRPAPSTNDYLNRKWSGSLSDPRLNGKVDEADLEYLYDYWTHWDHVTKLRLYRSSGMLADEVLNDPMEEKVFENVSLRKARYRVGVLEAREQTGTPEYAARKLEISMIEEAGIQKGRYVYFWDQMENQTQYFGLLFGVLYIMLVSRVFATEYATGMYMLLASTRQGKRQAAYSKLLACGATGLMVVLALNLLPAAVYLLGGTTAGGEETLNNLTLFPYSPYNITIAQYFLLKIGIELLSILAVGAVTAFLSLKFRSAVPAATAGLAVLLYPFAVNLIDGGREHWFTLFSPGYGMCPVKVFDRFHVLTIFGQPVLYPIVLAVVLVLFIVLFVLLTCRSYSRGKCNVVR